MDSSPVAQKPLEDKPEQPWLSFDGYLHKKDPTLLSRTKLTYPTVNVFMPDGDKIVPRGGSKVLGQEATQNSGIIGHLEKYKNVSGIEMEIRVWNDNSITLTGIVGTFVSGETITGGTSAATATVNTVNGSVLTIENLVGIFQAEVVIGGTSGATGTISISKGDVVEVLYQGLFRQITRNINPLQKGVSNIDSTIIYYFDQWVDTNLDPSLSSNANRAIWVMGLNKIRSWTGGIAPVVSVVVNTSVTTTAGVTWASLGFPSPTQGGSNQIVVNGVTYTVSAGWDTSTLLIANTSGIIAGNIAFSGIQEITTTVALDVVSCFKNYPCYGNWNIQKFFIGNNFNRPATQEITDSQALQNDLVLVNSSYTGTGRHVYEVTIDSVNPNVNQQEFISAGGGLNDGVYNTSGYSGTAGVKNIYRVSMVGDFSLLLSAVSGVFTFGEVVKGGTSNATAYVVFTYTVGAQTQMGLRMLSGSFVAGETITGQSSTETATIDLANYQNYFQYSKNGVVVNTNVGAGSQAINPLNISVITLSDGLTIQFSNYFGHEVGDVFQLTINQGGTDTFQWNIDGGAPVATGVAITAANQTLSNGVVIRFVKKTGHQVGDFWDISVDQNIGVNNDNAYGNFYYGIPRKPGEGFIGNLPANFWAMKPQEGNMYINDASGKWGYLETKLSADLTSETIEYIPLKQASRNKVIFPYMLGYLDNDIAYVTEDKNLDFIGRKQLIELPQTSHLSDDVKLDFLAASFEGGSIEFNSLRLYVTSPRDLLMFCWDDSQKYWQPPQLIPENGILSQVGLDLISHSNIRNVTNTLFVGKNDNGQEFPIKIRTGYNIYGDRWQIDIANMLFVEGYMLGNPNITARALLNVNGCSGVVRSLVEPDYCVPSTLAPLGYGSLGSHSLGSDEDNPMPYFQWIGVGNSPFKFYMAAMDLECNSKDPDFEILSMGLNTVKAEGNNSKLKRGQIELI